MIWQRYCCVLKKKIVGHSIERCCLVNVGWRSKKENQNIVRHTDRQADAKHEMFSWGYEAVSQATGRKRYGIQHYSIDHIVRVHAYHKAWWQ